MSSTIMNSNAPTEFFSFPKLPAELRLMVWEEALPTLDFQRFNAEIAPDPNVPNINISECLVLCLTPNDDFIQLTSGYLSLLGACHESRRAAIAKVNCYLPINYIVCDGNGKPAVRFARVPFNPDGQLYISGLVPAIHAAAEGHGARGMKIQTPRLPQFIVNDIQCVTFPEIKNVTIALDTPKDPDYQRPFRFIRSCDDLGFENLARRMAKLETVAVIDEEVLTKRHQTLSEDLEWLHKWAPVIHPSVNLDGCNNKMPWLRLCTQLECSMYAFKLIKEFRDRYQ